MQRLLMYPYLTVGMVNDMFVEKSNDEYDWKIVATQDDFDRF